MKLETIEEESFMLLRALSEIYKSITNSDEMARWKQLMIKLLKAMQK